MPAWPVLASLPEGVECIEGSSGLLAVATHARADVLAAGFGPDGGEQLAPSGLSGRTRLDALPLSDGTRAVVRRFTHGGLARVVTGERYADPQRPFQELVHAHRLREAGVPTPEVLAARAIRVRPFGWNLALVTRRLEGLVDLGVLLEARRAGEGTRAGWWACLRAAGLLVGRLHAVEFLHADLHPRNLLLAAGALSDAPPLAHVLDLDRSRFVALNGRMRCRNLARFLRAVQKREQRGASFLSRTDHLRFLRGYDEGLGRMAPTGRTDAWREDWRRVRGYAGATGWWHALGWRLERLLGRGPESRDGAARVRVGR